MHPKHRLGLGLGFLKRTHIKDLLSFEYFAILRCSKITFPAFFPWSWALERQLSLAKVDLLQTSCFPLLQLPPISHSVTESCYHCSSLCPTVPSVSGQPPAAGISGQLLAAELTLCAAAICVSPLYPATDFLKACQNIISLQNLSALANGITSCEETMGVQTPSYILRLIPKTNPLSAGGNPFSKIQVSMIETKPRGRDDAVTISAWP